MNWREACIFTSWVFAIPALILLYHDCLLGLVYLASAIAAFVYHDTDEQEFVQIDHALAWAGIAANCWLAWWSKDNHLTLVSIALILLALEFYHKAKAHNYEKNHTIWHLLCGAAGTGLAVAYLGR
jgi:hypothetical protein